MYVTMKQKYFGSDMYKSAYDYVTPRDICQRVKRDMTGRSIPLQLLQVDSKFAQWSMDRLAGLSKTKQSYIYTYDTHIIRDRFTLTLVRGSTCTNENPGRIRDCIFFFLYKVIFTRYGAPRTLQLVSDRGQNLMSKILHLMEHVSGDETGRNIHRVKWHANE